MLIAKSFVCSAQIENFHHNGPIEILREHKVRTRLLDFEMVLARCWILENLLRAY